MAPDRMTAADRLQLCVPDTAIRQEQPYTGEIRAGFPSPAQDYLHESIDLNRELVSHPETTFYARVAGNSMEQAGIHDGDLVVIDKSLDARNGDYVAAYIDGEFTLKEFRLDPDGQCAWLIPANPAYRPIRVSEENRFAIWGVVTCTIHNLRRK